MLNLWLSPITKQAKSTCGLISHTRIICTVRDAYQLQRTEDDAKLARYFVFSTFDFQHITNYKKRKPFAALEAAAVSGHTVVFHLV